MANIGPDAVGGSAADEVVEIINPSGSGRFVLVCEHASNFIPAELENLGLDDGAVGSHIAWDPGAIDVARQMSLTLDAPLVAQRVSRLVYDCNRPPEAESAVPPVSDIYQIPGNTGLPEADRRARAERYYAPFRDALAACLDRHVAGQVAPVMVTVHSFTPVFQGVRRDVDIGVIHDSDARLADALLGISAAETKFVIRRNAPYGPQDGVTHTLSQHALPRGLLNVMIEIRSDLIVGLADQQSMAAWLSRCVTEAVAAVADPAERRPSPTAGHSRAPNRSRPGTVEGVK